MYICLLPRDSHYLCVTFLHFSHLSRIRGSSCMVDRPRLDHIHYLQYKKAKLSHRLNTHTGGSTTSSGSVILSYKRPISFNHKETQGPWSFAPWPNRRFRTKRLRHNSVILQPVSRSVPAGAGRSAGQPVILE